MNARPLSPRNRTIGLVTLVSIIMVGAAMLASAGAGLASPSSSGGANGSSTGMTLPASSTVSPAGRTSTVSVNDFNFSIGSSPPPTPIPAAPSSSRSATAAQSPSDPPITLTPTQGPSGTSVLVAGSGFVHSEIITTTIGAGATIGTCGATVGGGPGDFSCTVTISGTASGTPYTVTATGSAFGHDTGTAPFTITTPTITVSPAQGPVGATYTVTGSGFSVMSVANVVFNSVRQTPSACSDGTLSGTVITTDATGGFACTFTVPNEGAAAYDVVGEDWLTNTPTSAQTFTVTASAITVNPTQGPVGATVTISGTGFSVSTALVSLVFDSVSITSCTSGSLTTGATGAFSCTFKVPSGTSGTTVTATDVSGQVATGAFTVTSPAITVNPTQGPLGATITVSGTGFSVTRAVGLVFDGVTVASCTIGSLTTSAAGAFTCTFKVPSGTSGTAVTATDVGGRTAIGTFTVTLPAIIVDQMQGPVGATVAVSGTGFSVTRTVGLVFDGVTIASCDSGSLTTGGAGAFSCTFAVPSGTSGTTVTVTDVGGEAATGTFTVTIPTLALTPTQGLSGVTVAASGSGFTPDVTITFTITTGGTIGSASSCSATGTGAYSGCSFTISGSAVTYTVTATGSDGSLDKATASFTVTTPVVTLTPTQGPSGVSVGVSGTGFTHGATVTTTIGAGATIGACRATVSGTGTFSCAVTISGTASATPYTVTATGSDGGNDRATAYFTITTPAITLAPTQGPSGVSVGVSGTGFTHGATITTTIGAGATIGTCGATVSGTGTFSCTVTISGTASGTSYTVTAAGSDGGNDRATTSFTITTPVITLTPTQGPTGIIVTVSGTGFTPSTTINTLTFNGTIPFQTCTDQATSGTGTFSCTFTVPTDAASSVPYSVVVAGNDGGSDTSTASFTMTTPEIMVTPGRGPVGAMVTVSGTGFSVSTALTSLEFDSTKISSCTGGGSLTTNDSGTFSCTITVLRGAAGTTVTATDVGGQTATGVFMVTTPAITMSPTQGPVGTTVTVSGTDFSVTSTVGLVFDGVKITSCTSGSLTTSGTGTFTCTFKVPTGTSGTTVTATDVGGQTATGTLTVTTSSSFPWIWVYVAIVLVAIVAVALAVLFTRRRRREPAAVVTPIAPWDEGPYPPTGGGPAAAAPPPAETPEQVGQAPSAGTPAKTGGAAAAITVPVLAKAKSDTDVFTTEVHKLSDEIVKKPRKNGTSSQGGESVEEGDRSS
jgi:hypothetical protein